MPGPRKTALMRYGGSMATTRLHTVILARGPSRTASRQHVPTAVGPGGSRSISATGDPGAVAYRSTSAKSSNTAGGERRTTTRASKSTRR